MGDVAVAARAVLDVSRCFTMNVHIGSFVVVSFHHQRRRFILNGRKCVGSIAAIVAVDVGVATAAIVAVHDAGIARTGNRYVLEGACVERHFPLKLSIKILLNRIK